MSDGKDLRMERLTDRKHELRRKLSTLPDSPRLRYVDHVEQYGTALFHRVCKMDLEGCSQAPWFKIRNPKYSQMEGREKLFERERRANPLLASIRVSWRVVNYDQRQNPDQRIEPTHSSTDRVFPKERSNPL
jgi:hypothetical protein